MAINVNAADLSWFSSSSFGLPDVYSTDAAGIINILDTCLVKGYGEKSPISITVDGSNVVFSYGVGHNCRLFQKIKVEGAQDPLLNGVHKVVAVTNNTLSVRILGVTSTEGVITTRIASLGWESIFGFSDPLRRAYRSLDPSSSKRVLYIDMGYGGSLAGYDSGNPSRRAIVNVCDDMTVLGTQIGSATASINKYQHGTLLWHQSRGAQKSTAITRTPTNWKVIGNGRFFYLAIGWEFSGAKAGLQDVYGFGEYVTLGDNPADSGFLTCDNNINDFTARYVGAFGARMDGTQSGNHTYTISSTGLSVKGLSPLASPMATISGSGPALFPSPQGDYLFSSSCKMIDNGGDTHGFMPNMNYLEQSVSISYDDIVIDGLLIIKVNKDQVINNIPSTIGVYVGE